MLLHKKVAAGTSSPHHAAAVAPARALAAAAAAVAANSSSSVSGAGITMTQPPGTASNGGTQHKKAVHAAKMTVKMKTKVVMVRVGGKFLVK